MKNFLKVVAVGGLFLLLFLFFKNFYNENNITIKDERLAWEIKYKGVKGAVDFTSDEKRNLYIAYVDRIQFVDSKGKSYDILKDKTLNIKSIEYKDNKLYYTSNTKVFCYDLNKKEQKTLIGDLPNFGDYKDSIIRVQGNDLYITVGAATNSGVVGKDNSWISDNPFNFDISPKDITIKGKIFGNEKTGAFVPYKTKNISGQLMPGHFPGNASVIKYSLDSGYVETYAWGVRNIKSLSFNSGGTLIATIGGMEDRGLRPVKGDVDYIYEIKKGLWYGWPDYSGGDPVTSPRFKGENNNRLSFLLENHPTTNPPAPIYLHNNVSALGAMDIDTKGKFGEKDCIYFYDTRDNMIYGLTDKGLINEKVLLKSNSKIVSLKFVDSFILALDSSEGALYKLNCKSSNNLLSFGIEIIYYLIAVIIISIIIAVWRFNYNNNKA